MAIINSSEIHLNNRIKIDAMHDHDDLAGLTVEIGVVAIAQSIETKNYLVYPDDKQNPSPYILEPNEKVILAN